MILASTGYSAASRVITTTDELIDQLLAEYDGSGTRQVRYAYAGGFAPIQVAHGNREGQAFWRALGFDPLMDVLHRRLS